MRAMAEGLILLTWLTTQDDAGLYERFKEYGRGHLKLLTLHWEGFADSFDEVPEEVAAMIDDLDRLVNQDI